ncbi:hypothetical protein ACFQ7J_14445 [Streptomyces sp. NPDC056501]|uniref:hypothetical protein n=1 Tax=Streptomyces sp. NPDC056501 TaxID=3345841 RepID=UPI0036BAEBCC
MSAPAHRDPRRSPSTAPRAPSRTSPYGDPSALRPRKNSINLPPGHTADIKKEPTATEFLGKYFAQDSLDFLQWLAKYYWNDLTGVRVLLFLMGSQDVGGLVRLTQRKIAAELDLSEEAVSRAMTKARDLGIVYTISRGQHQLQPTVTLRGGYSLVDTPVRGAARRQVSLKVEQLSLLSELVGDPEVPEQFKSMSMPDAALPEPPARPSKESGKSKRKSEE